MLKAGDAVHLDAFCSACEASYYRTVRPLVVGRDKLSPDLFAPIKAGTPPPNPDKPLCPTCSAPLRFIAAATTGGPAAASADDNSSPVAPEEPPQPSQRRRPTAAASENDKPVRTSSVDVLFAVEPDEQVVDIKDADGAYLVVTNRRIVRVAY